MSKTALPLIFMLLVGVVQAADRPVPRTTPPIAVLVNGEKRSADVKQVASLVIQGTNAQRLKEGRQPLSVSPALAAAAEYFAGFMARTEAYGHEADGSAPAERAAGQGYAACIVAENIAYQYLSTGFSTTDLAQSFLSAWLDSPGHHANMVDADITEIGVAIARSARSGKYYAVQDFGRPRSRQIDFAVRNASGVAVSYVDGQEKVSLPARTTVRQQRCRPTTLVFRWPGSQLSTSVVVQAGREYQVTRTEKGSFRVETVAP